ncbi:UNVERIFIED_CONTAM: hypothetical protein GTU68_006597 [Idotea baltica]|nr:hypothetical protein [Idotea baltica]
MSGGKRLRPALVLLAEQCTANTESPALPAACAIEMIHTYSLIHDDLPSMDDDDLRRGRPTNHTIFGEALATLAGDALLTLAFETLGTAPTSPHATSSSLRILAGAAGGSGMVGGQILDLTNTSSGPALMSVDHLVRIHRMKTGALIRASLQLGAAVSQASEAEFERLTNYGNAIGLAFQIADDVLDVTGTNERLGKETGRDHQLGKLTYPGLIGLQASQEKARELVEQAVDALDIFDDRANLLRNLAGFIVERDH